MGKLQTAVILPRRILLQGWALSSFGEDVNGTYTFQDTPLFGSQATYLSDENGDGIYAICFFGTSWVIREVGDATQEWRVITTNKALPLNDWVQVSSAGPAGTITILENISGKNTKISIKKQNINNLYPYALDNFKNLYIFKGGGANTIGTVFNKDDFIKNISSSNADRLAIFTPDLTVSANYWVSSETNLWTRASNGAVSTDVVILENYVIVIFAAGDPSLNLPKSINNGAIVQRYNSGKISLFFDTLPLNTQSIRLNLGYELGGCGNDFVLGQNNSWVIGGCDYNVRWDNKNGTLPYRWRFYYNSDNRTDYASHPTAGPDSLPKKGWSNGMTISEIKINFITFGQSLVVNNLPFDADARCNFSFLNRTWIYEGAPSFRYRKIDSLNDFIHTPLTPVEYGGNGLYQIQDSEEVYFTNSYDGSDKFPSNNWQLAPYIIDNCPQITTTPVFSLL